MEQQQSQQDYSSYGNGSNNYGYNNAGALQIRLDTKPIIDKIRVYLLGREDITVQNDNGKLVTKAVYKGKAMVNEMGFQSIMNYIEIIFNAQVVQGNFDDDMFYDYLRRARMDLADHLMVNRKRFDIKMEDYNGIISTLFHYIYPFISRLRDDKERLSYAQTVRTSEILNTGNNKSAFSGSFWGGGK